jgi:hypothetical protein
MKNFEQLSRTEKTEARILWLERKLVGILWLLISLTSVAVGAFAAWFVGEVMEKRTIWLYAPVALVAWVVAGWLLKRSIFRGAPPHIEYLD